jgi:hypothetical protein
LSNIFTPFKYVANSYYLLLNLTRESIAINYNAGGNEELVIDQNSGMDTAVLIDEGEAPHF